MRDKWGWIGLCSFRNVAPWCPSCPTSQSANALAQVRCHLKYLRSDEGGRWSQKPSSSPQQKFAVEWLQFTSDAWMFKMVSESFFLRKANRPVGAQFESFCWRAERWSTKSCCCSTSTNAAWFLWGAVTQFIPLHVSWHWWWVIRGWEGDWMQCEVAGPPSIVQVTFFNVQYDLFMF